MPAPSPLRRDPVASPLAADDASLVRAYARTGDERALDAIVRRHWPFAFRIALRSLGDPAAAEDAAQEAMVALVRAAPRYDAGRPFRPFFATLVLNAVRMAGRRRGRRARHEAKGARRADEAADGDPAGAASRREMEARVMALPHDMRSAIVLHYYERLSHAEVARALGVPRGTVASRIRRGVETLRAMLGAAGIVLSVSALEEALASAGADAVAAVPAAPAGRALARLAATRGAGVAPLAGAAAAGLAITVAAALAIDLPTLRAPQAPRAAPEARAAAPERAALARPRRGAQATADRPDEPAEERPAATIVGGAPAGAADATSGLTVTASRWIPALAGLLPDEDPRVRAVVAQLRFQHVTLDVRQSNALDVVSAIERASGLPIRVDPDVVPLLREAPIDMKLRGIRLGSGLGLTLAQAEGVVRAIRDGGVWIERDAGAAGDEPDEASPRAWDVPLETDVPSEVRALRARMAVRVTVAFPGTPLADVARFLADLSGLPIAIGPEVDAAREVALRAEDEPLERVLTRATRRADAGWLIRKDAVAIVSAAEMEAHEAREAERAARVARGREVLERPAAGAPARLELASAAALAARGSGVEVRIAIDDPEARISLYAGDTLEMASDRMALATGGSWALRRDDGGACWMAWSAGDGARRRQIEALVREAGAARVEGAAPRAALDAALAGARGALEGWDLATQEGLAATSLAALRSARERAAREEAAAALGAATAWLLMDAIESADGGATDARIVDAHRVLLLLEDDERTNASAAYALADDVVRWHLRREPIEARGPHPGAARLASPGR